MIPTDRYEAALTKKCDQIEAAADALMALCQKVKDERQAGTFTKETFIVLTDWCRAMEIALVVFDEMAELEMDESEA
jgi:hypothetical protein